MARDRKTELLTSPMIKAGAIEQEHLYTYLLVSLVQLGSLSLPAAKGRTDRHRRSSREKEREREREEREREREREQKNREIVRERERQIERYVDIERESSQRKIQLCLRKIVS